MKQQQAPPQPLPPESTMVYIKIAVPGNVKVEDADRLVGDLRKGVGVAAGGDVPSSGILGPPLGTFR